MRAGSARTRSIDIISDGVADISVKNIKRRLWLPPRAHGEEQPERSVSFLELFYDLVYVVVIATLAGNLAHDITWRATADFAVLFGLIWLAWVNGTVYHDLHSRGDVRSRTFIFVQMMLIVLLAVYQGDHDEDFSGFAIVYAVLLGLFSWQWFTVRQQDPPELRSGATLYVTLLLATVVVIVVTIFLPYDAQTIIWAGVTAFWVIAFFLMSRRTERTRGDVQIVTESLVERVGLFTIIVLGEVVVGVVEGLTEVTRSAEAVASGLIALVIGFGLWWNYFDLTGRREPRNSVSGVPIWLIGQLPLTMSIAAAGASMLSLIEHASDSHTPVATAWLLAGAVSVSLLSLAVLMRTLEIYDRLRPVYHYTSFFMAAMSGGVLLIAVWRPAPLVFALLLVAALSAVWWFAMIRWLVTSDNDQPFKL